MNWKRTLVFLMILTGVAAYYFFSTREERAARQPIDSTQTVSFERILSLEDGEAIQKIALYNPVRAEAGQSVIILKRDNDGQWNIAHPVEHPAESVLADGFVSLLAVTRRGREFPLEEITSGDFGLTEPRMTVCQTTNLMPPKERCLLIGSEAAVAKDALYAKWNDEDRVFMVERGFLKAFDKSLYTLRRKQIFGVLNVFGGEDKKIQSLRYRYPNGDAEFVREGGQWMMKEGMKEVAVGSQAVHQLLLKLNRLYVKEFLDEAVWKDKSLGLQKAQHVIRITFVDGSKQTLLIGREAAGYDAYYGSWAEQKNVFLIALGKFSDIEHTFRTLIS